MPFGIVDPTVPVVKAQSDTVAKFCQIMPYHDGTGLIIGCGIGSHLKYNENTHYHDEAKRLGLDILSWKGVVLPRPIARKVIEDASLLLSLGGQHARHSVRQLYPCTKRVAGTEIVEPE